MGNHNYKTKFLLQQNTMQAINNNTIAPQVDLEQTNQVKQDTISTISVGTFANEEVEMTEGGKFLLFCNVCCTKSTSETDMSQFLPCGHVYIQAGDSKHKKVYTSVFDEMVFRMKAVMQGNENPDNKKIVDNYYEVNDKFMTKFPMYGRYKKGLQNMALFKKTKKMTGKSRWSRVRKQIKSLTWIYKNVNNAQAKYRNF